jgi:hypothetical protein
MPENLNATRKGPGATGTDRPPAHWHWQGSSSLAAWRGGCEWQPSNARLAIQRHARVSRPLAALRGKGAQAAYQRTSVVCALRRITFGSLPVAGFMALGYCTLFFADSA